MNTVNLEAEATLEQLKKLFGFDSFREHQQELVEGILSGRDAFGVMPTGGGKSLCYQLPASILPGTAVIVSPLIALMKDQVDSARSNGIKAAFLNSTLAQAEVQEIEKDYIDGNLDLLYLAPERLSLSTTVSLLRKNQQGAPSFIAIDEAHCISEWGHDFRPDYLFTSRLKELFPQSPLTAFTATATEQVAEDIEKRLQLVNPVKIRASFDRKNLFYEVLAKREAATQIVEFIRERPQQSGIIYRTSRKSVEETANMLVANGINAAPYHAGLPAEKRSATQDAFIRDDITVMVATVAFGMGVDKADVRFVIHGDLPKNIESYYQETGRAGRDGEPSHCLLLYSAGDLGKLRFFIEAMPDETEQGRARQLLASMDAFASVPSCRKISLLNYFDESCELENCGSCDYCAGSFETVDATRDAQIVLSAIMRTGNRFGGIHICDIVCGANTAKVRQFEHDKLKTYGVGKDKPKTHWRSVIDALVAGKKLALSQDKFPVPQINDAATEILFGRDSFQLAVDKRIALDKAQHRAEEIDCDHDFFHHLRDIRKELADVEGVPPYVVFSDKSLRAMAAYHPSNDSELLNISGVGQNKLEKYGQRFLSVIQEYLCNHPEITPKPQPLKKAAAPRVKQGLSGTFRTTLEMLNKGMQPAAIASERGLGLPTVEGHIARLITEGEPLDWQQWLGEATNTLCRQLFEEHGHTALKPIIEASNGKISYGQAKIVAALIQIENGQAL